MDATFEALLITCLDALDRGDPIEDILRRYPAQAAELRPILATAGDLAGLELAPTRAAESASRRQFLTEGAQIKAADPRASEAGRPSAQARPARFAWLGRPALAVVAMAAAVTMMFILSFSASASALPGDRLYALKRASERLQVALAGDVEGQAALHDAFNQRRIDEVNALLAAGREAEVDFIGVAEPAGDGAWRIDGVLAQVDDTTQILGDLSPGEHVHVRGRLADGKLRLSTVICLDDLPHWTPAMGPPPALTTVPTPGASSPTATTLPAPTDPPAADPPPATSPPPLNNAPAAGPPPVPDAPGSAATGQGDQGAEDDAEEDRGSDDDDKDRDNRGSGGDDDEEDEDDDKSRNRGSGGDDDDDDKSRSRGSGGDDDDDDRDDPREDPDDDDSDG